MEVYDSGLKEKYSWLFELWAELAAFFMEYSFYLKEQLTYMVMHLGFW